MVGAETVKLKSNNVIYATSIDVICAVSALSPGLYVAVHVASSATSALPVSFVVNLQTHSFVSDAP